MSKTGAGVWLRRLATASAGIVMAGAIAPPKSSAAWFAWEGEVELDFALPSLPALVVTGIGVAAVNGPGGPIHLTRVVLAGGVSGTAAAPVTDPLVPTLASVRATLDLGSGTLSPFSPVVTGSAPQLQLGAVPVGGLVRLCLIVSGCGQSLALGLTKASGAVGLGVGGVLTAGGGPTGISLQAAPWTVRSATIPVPTSGGQVVAVTAHGWAHGPVSFTSSTALTGGALSLVTPMRVTSEAGQALAMFGSLTLRFVPEPGAPAVLGAGVVVLLALGLRRARR